MSDTSSNKWTVCWKEVPRREVIFFAQVIILYVVICVSLTNLSLGVGNQTLWSSLLADSLGYLLPSPTIGKKQDEPLLPSLLSNNSMEFYSNNTLTNYTTKLAVDVSLRGEWEVGLSEIISPKTG